MQRRVTLIGISIICVSLYALAAFGRDLDGRHAQAPAEQQRFFRGLTDKQNVSCCDEGDGTDVEDWDPQNHKAKIAGEWLDIPESARLSKRNPYGAARAWIFKMPDGSTHIRCFIGGNLT